MSQTTAFDEFLNAFVDDQLDGEKRPPYPRSADETSIASLRAAQSCAT